MEQYLKCLDIEQLNSHNYQLINNKKVVKMGQAPDGLDWWLEKRLALEMVSVLLRKYYNHYNRS